MSHESYQDILASDVINNTRESLVKTEDRSRVDTLIVMFDSDAKVSLEEVDFSNNLVDEVSRQTDTSFFLITL